MYLANCAVCHGKQGKGDGPFAGVLDTRVADLTTLAKQNGGVFPFARVYEIIDGEQVVKAHGPRDMPIWGTEFRIRGAENYGEFPYDAGRVCAGPNPRGCRVCLSPAGEVRCCNPAAPDKASDDAETGVSAMRATQSGGGGHSFCPNLSIA